MKQVFIFALFVGLGLYVNAQTIVSTSPAPKNVVLEEYTGINCPYCPDGHRIANEIAAANPGKAFPINIHQGSYSTPSAGQPDYRTAFGDALANQTGLTGYPCGTINRHVFTSPAPMTSGETAHSRGNFVNCANQIMAQTSPVNVAINATLNEATRELSILVEVYYTANEATATNKLNIAVLQDYVVGPQSGSSYNPDYITGTNYYHMHMLRNLIFGQWGLTIPTTTSGTFFDTAFVYTVPATYGVIPAELYNLKLVAFVSQGNQEILSAGEFKVPYPLDAGIDDLANIPAMTCGTTPFTPTVRLYNNGLATITAADINYSIDGATPSVIAFAGSLAPGDDTVITFPAITPASNGTHTFEVSVTEPNGIADYSFVNDELSASFVTFVTSITAPVVQPFTATTFPPADWVLSDNNNGTNWLRSTQGCFAAGSAVIKWFNISDGIDDLVSYPMDFSSMTGAALTFNYAHRQYSTSYSDKLQVDVSTDCGATWTNVWNKAGSQLATTTVSTAEYTSVLAAHWRFVNINLAAYDGEGEVLVRFRATSGYGNNLFLDDINIAAGITQVEESENTDMLIFPNPANDNVSVKMNVASTGSAYVTVINSLGEVVYSSNENITTGINTIQLNTTSLNDGIYFVNVQVDGNTSSNSFMIAR